MNKVFLPPSVNYQWMQILHANKEWKNFHHKTKSEFMKKKNFFLCVCGERGRHHWPKVSTCMKLHNDLHACFRKENIFHSLLSTTLTLDKVGIKSKRKSWFWRHGTSCEIKWIHLAHFFRYLLRNFFYSFAIIQREKCCMWKIIWEGLKNFKAFSG